MRTTMARMAAALVLLATGGMVFAAARRQEEPGPAKAGKPHELLKQFEGTWETKSEFQMGPEGPLMKSTGTESDKFIVGGLFLGTDAKADMGGWISRPTRSWATTSTRRSTREAGWTT